MFQGTYNEKGACAYLGLQHPQETWSPAEAPHVGQLQTLRDRTQLVQRGQVQATHRPSRGAQVEKRDRRAPPEPLTCLTSQGAPCPPEVRVSLGRPGGLGLNLSRIHLP